MSKIELQETTPIVDCDVLEAAKENIQPLASGRRVIALSAVLSTPHAQRESQHNSIKSRHRINITVALEGDDPDDDLSKHTVDLFIGLWTRIHKDIVPTLVYWSCWKELRAC